MLCFCRLLRLSVHCCWVEVAIYEGVLSAKSGQFKCCGSCCEPPISRIITKHKVSSG